MLPSLANHCHEDRTWKWSPGRAAISYCNDWIDIILFNASDWSNSTNHLPSAGVLEIIAIRKPPLWVLLLWSQMKWKLLLYIMTLISDEISHAFLPMSKTAFSCLIFHSILIWSHIGSYWQSRYFHYLLFYSMFLPLDEWAIDAKTNKDNNNNSKSTTTTTTLNPSPILILPIHLSRPQQSCSNFS